MNEAIRNAVRDAMKAKGLTQEQMAERIGVHRVHVNRMLTGASSDVPDAWQKMLDEVGLDLAPVLKDNP
ncbi:helix-turn-helix transcriptional regulator [Deinococcus frigens]|uniref:helix-turn-helix transcriptional regulator n=1 Tax=Deinococcus frigens TaxID=249403 RepID=UPI00049549CF|nr:helix-turn-helix transcriptional regulator [Deinococcus frigens]